jgi:hypothetical protein
VINRSWRQSLAVALNLSFASSSAHDPRCTPARPAVVVLLYNYAQVPGDLLDRTRHRVDGIFSDTEVAIDWVDPIVDARYRVSPDRNSLGVFTIQMVIRTQLSGAWPGSPRAPAGTTPHGPHESGGSAFVFYDRVCFIALEYQQDIWEVLACAIAHEMGHVLLPAPAHSTTGIMRPTWDKDDMRHARFGGLRFTAAQIEEIRKTVTSRCGANP